MTFSSDAPLEFNSFDEVDLSCFRPRSTDFDLLIIGSGPAGQKAAQHAARTGARIALVERDPLAGGVCLNTGTIPSKSLREAVLYLTGYRQRGYYGQKYHLKERITAGELYERTNHVIRQERNTINEALEAERVVRMVGEARILGPNEVEIHGAGTTHRATAANILVAVGTRTRRPPEVPFDDMNIFDSDAVFGPGNELRPLPNSLIVLGAGVIGIEYASMFAALEIPTTLVDPRPNPLGFVDADIVAILYEQLRRNGVRLVFGKAHERIELLRGDHSATGHVHATLAGGEAIEADALLFALGRVPATASLGLREAGVELDARGYVKVDEHYRTSVPSIFAAGDVVGFPSLAATSAEQGRIAALNALGVPVTWHPDSIPYGIYTIPEISMVGRTEDQLRTEGTPFFSGTALWRDTARGKILGDHTGAMKLLFHGETKKLLGVHMIGEGATELLHIGQAVMHFGGGPEYFLNTVFNYPTLAEAYKIAATNAVVRAESQDRVRIPLLDQVLSGSDPDGFVTWR